MINLNQRLPDDLHKTMKVLAEKEKRSLNSEILFIFEEYIKQMKEIEQK